MSDTLSRFTLLISAIAFFAVGTVGYLSGSTPEWVLLKGSIGIAVVGLAGWLISLLINARNTDEAEGAETGVNVDVTLSDLTPGSESGASAALRTDKS